MGQSHHVRGQDIYAGIAQGMAGIDDHLPRHISIQDAFPQLIVACLYAHAHADTAGGFELPGDILINQICPDVAEKRQTHTTRVLLGKLSDPIPEKDKCVVQEDHVLQRVVVLYPLYLIEQMSDASLAHPLAFTAINVK